MPKDKIAQTTQPTLPSFETIREHVKTLIESESYHQALQLLNTAQPDPYYHLFRAKALLGQLNHLRNKKRSRVALTNNFSPSVSYTHLTLPTSPKV